MNVAIMQPYFLPYLGYFQLACAVDTFVIYDKIEFSKRGWIHRNRILGYPEPQYMTLPLKKAPDKSLVSDRFLADTWLKDKIKLSNKIYSVYQKAHFFESTFNLVEDILNSPDTGLHNFVLRSIKLTLNHLKLFPKIICSSELETLPMKRNVERVIDICHSSGATIYTNPIGGKILYSKEEFAEASLKLQFLEMDTIEYEQFDTPFLSHLSIVDALMFNGPDQVRSWVLNDFSIQ